MYNKASEKFNTLITAPGRTFRARLLIGDEILEGISNVKLTTGSNNGDALTLGSTISQMATITMENSGISLSGKEFTLQIGLKIGEDIEYIPMGVFTTDKIEVKADKLSITAYDRMIKLSSGYLSDLPEETDTVSILREMAQKSGVPISVEGLVAIPMAKPVGYTYREVLMYVSQLHGGFANVNREGTVEIHFWTDAGYILDADMGINGFTAGDSYTVNKLTCATRQDEEGNTTSISAGEGTGISVSNPFMTQEILDAIYSAIKGFTYDAVTCPVILGDPRLDPWDLLTIQSAAGTEYMVPVMSLEYSYDGGLSMTITSTTSPESEESFDYKGPMQQFEERMVSKVAIVESLTAKKASIEELEATKAQIDTLSAGMITTENLTAKVAELGYLKASELEAKVGTFGYLKTTELSAKVATLGYLKVAEAQLTYATINKLDATNANISTLQATVATIEKAYISEANVNKLLADYVKTTTLKADYLTAESIKATYATVSNLNAANANISALQTKVGDISTLMFGTASGGSLTTEFSNSVIALIGDATISSAKILSLMADKITSGTINTNKVTVKSDNGRLQITGDTILIKDANRTRVQIGKDTNADYNIYILDKNGKVMFDATGIHADAIKSPIIEDAMVSEDANISADKLNIDSLFSEINGSTNTIKSTKIYLDDKKQTLDVAFGSITTNITDLSKTVSSQGTAISTIQGQITSKIWQFDIAEQTDALDTKITAQTNKYNTLSQELSGLKTTVGEHTSQIANKADGSTVTAVSNRVTSVETSLSGLKTEVSATYATKTEFNNLTIGGRNLFIGSSKWREDSPAVTGTASDAYLYLSGAMVYLEKDKTYTLQAVCDLPWSTAHGAGTGTGKGTIWLASSDRKYHRVFVGDGVTSGRYTWTFTHVGDTGTYNIRVNGYNQATSFWDIKIETGNKATDWTPAPEDMATEADLTTLETRVTQTEGKITSQATSISNHETRISTVEQTASGLTVSLETTNKNVTTAQSTANAAKTAAANAQTTANAAKTAADNAAKTATNFLSYDSSGGLQIGNKSSGSWSGYRTQITSSAFNILDASGTVLASYGNKLVELGKNDTSAVIKMCGEKGQMSYGSYDGLSGSDWFGLKGENIAIYSTTGSSIFSKNSSGSYSYLNVTTDGVIASVGALATYLSILSGKIALKSSEIGLYGTTYLSNGATSKGEILISTGTTQSAAKGIKWSAINSKNPYIGYATNQTDGTFVVGSLLGTTYESGLAIGGGSGNLLWKGVKVATVSDLSSYVANSAAKLSTARTLTIGSKGKTFDGSANVSWTLAEIGAAAASHTHSYLPLSGGTLTGNLSGQYITGTWLQTTATSNLTSAATKIAVLDGSGWVYYRTPAQILSDIGAASSGHTHNALYNSALGKNIQFVASDSMGYFRPDTASLVYNGSETYPWYKTYTERLEVTKERPKFIASYNNTNSYATNCYIGNTGLLTRTTNTSSRTIKHDIKPIVSEDIAPEKLYDVTVYQFKYNEDILTDTSDARYSKDLPGFVIEELAEQYPIAVDRPTENVREWSWNAQYLIPGMLKLIQEQHRADRKMEQKMREQEARIEQLNYQIQQLFDLVARQNKILENLAQ